MAPRPSYWPRPLPDAASSCAGSACLLAAVLGSLLAVPAGQAEISIMKLRQASGVVESVQR